MNRFRFASAALAVVGLVTSLQWANAQEQKGGATITSKGTEAPADPGQDPTNENSDTLHVCADPGSLPQSNDRGEGYENKIAEALAHDLGKKVAYTYFPQRMGFVRMTIRARDTQTLKFKCDVIMGVPKGYDLTATTQPYMHSTYALVFPDRADFRGVNTPADFIALGPQKLHKLRIGIFGQSPAADWLLQNGLIESAQMYAAQSGDPKENPGVIIERDMSSGKIDVAAVWGPFAGMLVSNHTGANGWRTVPFKPEEKIKFDYEMSMGVRFGEKEWKDTLDKWIATHRPQIQSILASYHIPLLDVTQPAQTSQLN
jgi:quinoprotein dehydrogenase-associated probable ABC transporter substrate-binding protein